MGSTITALLEKNKNLVSVLTCILLCYAAQTSKYGRPSHDVSPTGSAPGTPRAYGSVNKPSPPPPPAAKPWQTAASSKPWQTAQNNNQPSPPAPAPAPKPWVASSGTYSAGPAPQAAPKPWQARKDYVTPSPPPAYGSPAPAPAPAPALAPNNNGNGSGPNVHLHVSAFSPGIVASVAAAAASTAYQQGKTALGKKPPPPPVPKRMGARPMVIALYDYDAQQAGDLSFRKDDRIEIVERTANADDWWTGKLNGQQGVFPGNLFFSCSCLVEVKSVYVV